VGEDEEGDVVTEERVCTDCGRRFFILGPEIEHLQKMAAERGWIFALPRRCIDCRAARRGSPAVRAEGDERARKRYDEEDAAWAQRARERGSAAGRQS
jgi:hypothetical protein